MCFHFQLILLLTKTSFSQNQLNLYVKEYGQKAISQNHKTGSNRNLSLVVVSCMSNRKEDEDWLKYYYAQCNHEIGYQYFQRQKTAWPI